MSHEQNDPVTRFSVLVLCTLFTCVAIAESPKPSTTTVKTTVERVNAAFVSKHTSNDFNVVGGAAGYWAGKKLTGSSVGGLLGGLAGGKITGATSYSVTLLVDGQQVTMQCSKNFFDRLTSTSVAILERVTYTIERDDNHVVLSRSTEYRWPQ